MTNKPKSEGQRSGEHQRITTDDQLKDNRVGHEAIRVDEEGEPKERTDHASPSLDDLDKKK
jgi:hypothetical protein